MFSSFGVKPLASGFQSYSYSNLKTHFEENGLLFWVPGVLHQCSEVVLWKLFSIQMTFWWICGGVLVLFLAILGPPSVAMQFYKRISSILALESEGRTVSSYQGCITRASVGKWIFFSHLKVMTGKANRILWVDFPGLTLILPSTRATWELSVLVSRCRPLGRWRQANLLGSQRWS